MAIEGASIMLNFLKKVLRTTYQRSYLSKDVKLHSSARIFHPNLATIGKYVYIGPDCKLNAEGGLQLGEGTILGPEVVILTSSHDFRSGDLLPYDVFDVHRPVTIGAGVWIGYRAMISPGVTIGDGAVVAMGAVVVRDVEAGAVVGGNPAKKISVRDQSAVAKMVKKGSFFHREYWSGGRPRKESKRT